MPRTPHVGISLKIEDEAERDRLRDIVARCIEQEGIEEQGGFILRTAAEGAREEDILVDIRYLRRLWQQISQQINSAPAPSVLYEDLPLALRTLRDLVNPRIEKIRIDSRETFQKVEQFVQELMPGVEGVLEHYPGERPVFDLYGVEDEIHKALERKVMLKSGGYLVIDQTEAMTTIDVNTGAFVGHRNLEETIFKTNLEAASTIARQLRLRNLGGIIILEFVDMQLSEYQRQVLRTQEKALVSDHAMTRNSDVSELGLVEMARKRTRECLGQVMCEPGPVCAGREQVQAAETVCYELFREILREARTYNNDKFLVLAAPVVVDRLLDEEAEYVADLEAFIGRTIEFQVETLFTQEQYDIVLV